MEEYLKIGLIYGLIPFCIWVVKLMMNSRSDLISRINILERTRPTKDEVRETLDPIKDDIHEIKERLDKIVDLLLYRKD